MSVLGHELNRGIRSVFSNELQKRTPSQLLIVQMEDGGGGARGGVGGGCASGSLPCRSKEGRSTILVGTSVADYCHAGLSIRCKLRAA